MNRFAALVFLAAIAAQSQQSAMSPDAGEQYSIDQLRAIVESIKSCPPVQMPPDIDMQGFISTDGPPINVVWNVELHPSIRGRYVGSLEFVEPSSVKPPPEEVICSKSKGHVAYCKHVWEINMQIYERQLVHPLRFKYEFDVTPHGLEFVGSFKKTTQTDGEPWVAGGIDSSGCAKKAIKTVLDSPNESTRISTSQITASQENRPPEIPKALWDAAKRGETDAQFTIGTMYEEGNGIPQDYAEAYFWLDIAASGNSDSTIRDVLIKTRDVSASHLTSTILLQTQERARKWVENHLSGTDQKR
jgi:TPR repeat protein